MWLVGVVIRRYIDILIIIINFPYSTCIRSFLAAASLLLCSFLNVFSVFNNNSSSSTRVSFMKKLQELLESDYIYIKTYIRLLMKGNRLMC